MNNILKLANLSKKYVQGTSAINVLQNINLDIAKGEILSITGCSGTGKSTLLQIAGLLDSAYEGNIFYGNTNVKHLSEHQKADLRLNKIGFIYQYHHLLKDFTALENVLMPALIKGGDMAIAQKIALEILASLGVEDRAEFYPGQLSGGQQQRVAIARAMMNKPDIIFADEPTGNLDYSSADKVFELFIQVAKSNNIAVVMVTHNEQLAAKCARKLYIKEAALVEKE
ncbi:MAG: ABC transporter ATP-binding protein [Rickettsiaceae bacterium]|nr:ABC transporter ATP-binding protein [Rickettsiaceae bacterium]